MNMLNLITIVQAATTGPGPGTGPGGPTGGNVVLTNIGTWIAGIATAIIAIVMMIVILKDVASFVKGSGDASIGKIVAKVFVLVVMIALIWVAKSTLDGKGFATLGEEIGEVIENGVDNIKIGN